MTTIPEWVLEVRRETLVERVQRAQPKLLALIAPAGFGKSTLARQLIIGRQAAICDAAGVCDDLDLARRLVPALAVESPERTQALTQRELMLGDGGTSVAERVNLALEAWKTPTDSTFFVFENAEHIVRNTSARELFARLLTQRPVGRTVVLCARENLRMHLTRFAAPHEILTLRAEDLAFNREELALLFGKIAAEHPALLTRILQLSQGWPIAVFLLKRFANEGRMEGLLESLDDVAFEELHDYLADQVLATLETPLVDALFACASIGLATAADLHAALADERAVHALAEFARQSPFVQRNDSGEFVMHPMLASLLLEHREEQRNELLQRTAQTHEEHHRYQRAAELQLARGDKAAAAHALAQHEVIRDHAPSMEYARVLSSLDHALVQRYPRLWGVTALLRIFSADTESLLDEAESLWRTLSPDASPIERYYILAFRGLFMSYMGLLHEATELVEKFGEQNAVGDKPQNHFEGYIFYLLGMLRARSGQLTRAEADLTSALPFVGSVDVMASGTLLALGVDIARPRGEFAVARQLVERSLQAAERSGLQNFVAFDLAEATIGAWLAGDEAALARNASRFDETVQRNGVNGLQYFSAIVNGRQATPQDADLLKWVAWGRIVEASAASDASAAVKSARAALDAAEQYGAPFTECLANVTLAHFDRIDFDARMRTAINCAERCESPALRSAVYAIADRRSDSGMLTAFMRRLERDRVERVPLLEIGVAGGTVRAGGRDVTLTDREQALLVALALRREVVPRARLAALLWPELDDYAARNALSVCLHRLRAHLGVDTAVVRVKDGYALHTDVRVDLWEAERVMTALRGRATLGETERAALQEVYRSMRVARPARMKQWDWFEATERHIAAIYIEAAHRLAADAMRMGDSHYALELALEMVAYDACDETARHLAISAHLAAGDRGAALRQYREYRDTLAAELQVEPSAEIKLLVGLS